MNRRKILQIEHDLIESMVDDIWDYNHEDCHKLLHQINGITSITSQIIEELDEEDYEDDEKCDEDWN